MDNKKKISLIKKYLKKDEMVLELMLINYEGVNLYIFLGKHHDVYRLYYFNLNDVIDKKIEKYLSCSYILDRSIQLIENDFSTFNVLTQHNNQNDEDNTVILNANLKTKEDQTINISFNDYLPAELSYLANLFGFIFDHISQNYRFLLDKIFAELTNSKERYEYKKEFDFDLFNGDIDNLFDEKIVARGHKYYKENRIFYLEKIEDKYISVVFGSQPYITIIKYDEKDNKMMVYCSCPCEFYCKHMYAVIMAIRNNELKKFPRIYYKNESKSTLENIMEFNYYLCVDISENEFVVIGDYGNFEFIPILDENGQYNWQVVEENDDCLTKKVDEFLKLYK